MKKLLIYVYLFGCLIPLWGQQTATLVNAEANQAYSYQINYQLAILHPFGQ